MDHGTGDESTEAETMRRWRSGSATITRRLVPLGRSSSAPIEFGSRERNCALVEQAFDDGEYQFK